MALFSKRLLPALCLLALLGSLPARAHEHDGDDAEHAAHHARSKGHSKARRSFASQPAVGTWAKCPVSGESFQVEEGTKFATHGGRVFAFCCPGCSKDFAEAPDKYAGTSVR